MSDLAAAGVPGGVGWIQMNTLEIGNFFVCRPVEATNSRARKTRQPKAKIGAGIAD